MDMARGDGEWSAGADAGGRWWLDPGGGRSSGGGWSDGGGTAAVPSAPVRPAPGIRPRSRPS